MKTQGIISLISQIRRAANQYILDALKAKGLDGISTSHGDILSLLADGKQLPMKEISLRIRRKKNTVTVLVEKLIRLGYIKKGVSELDSRVVLVSLTPKGLGLMPDFNQISAKLLRITYEGLSESEKDQMVFLLEKVLKNFQTYRE